MINGPLLGGRYELLRQIGRGGQSVIWRARDHYDGDEVAIKLVDASLVRDPDAIERIFREAVTLSQLQGTSAVRILHQVRDDRTFGLVMELLEGQDLETHLVAREGRGERPNLPWLEETFGPIIATLEAAHARDLVHRDLKAENIFVIDPAKGGGVRLLDFGFVKQLRALPITDNDAILGSPEYIAPETFSLGANRVDARADVYGLSVIFFRTLAGRMPFTGTLIDLLREVTTAPRPSLHAFCPWLTPDIDSWVQQALAIDPDERFATVRATWMALKSCLR